MLFRSNFDTKQTGIITVNMWWVLAIALVLSALSLVSLRSNNLTMLDKRQAVIEADESGKTKEEINSLLLDLRDFTGRHMNTQMDQPLQLVNTYNRDNSAHHRQALEGLATESVYQDAENACQLVDSIQRAGCISDYVAKNGSADNIQAPKDLGVEAYQYLFIAPRWSFDIAGLSIITAGAAWVVLLYQIINRQIVKYYLKQLG